VSFGLFYILCLHITPEWLSHIKFLWWEMDLNTKLGKFYKWKMFSTEVIDLEPFKLNIKWGKNLNPWILGRVSSLFNWIWDSHRIDYEEWYNLGYDSMYCSGISPAFQRNILPPSSGSKSKPNRQLASCFILVVWRTFLIPKCQYTFSGLYGNTTQKTVALSIVFPSSSDFTHSSWGSLFSRVQWLRLTLSNGSNRVGASHPFAQGQKQIKFPTSFVL
jgi:hypothetical protein